MAPTPSNTLDLRSLSRRFGRTWVLQRVSVTIPSGGSVMLLGNNGSGKTTLLRCLATALRPHDGQALLGGQDLWADRARLRHDLVLLSHHTGLYADLSAHQNLRFWSDLLGRPADLPALLQRVGLAHTGDRPVRQFSAGMTRRLALATALLKQPRLLLLDEPFTALDADGRDLVFAVAAELRATGATLVTATHDPRLGARLADRALRLDGGRIVWDGPSSEVIA